MKKNLHLKKGNLLERAVEAIYTQIIKTNHSLKHAQLTIKSKKIIKVNGAKKEIDLHIIVDPGDTLDFVVIFECKNWKEKVNANEIALFAKKIEHTQASKGFFIAKDYTKDALAEANSYPRMLLLTAEDTDIDLSLFPSIHGVIHNNSKRKIKIILKERLDETNTDTSTTALQEIKPETETLLLNNHQTNFNDFLEKTLLKAEKEKIDTEPTANFEEGIYSYHLTQNLSFLPNECLYQNHDIETIEIEWTFEIEIRKPKIIAQFDIKSKGIYLKQEIVSATGQIIEMELVAHRSDQATERPKSSI